MEKQEKLINFIVIAALIGYIVCSIWSFIEVFGKDGKEINNALVYITGALTGLVGGIVAAAFGVKPSEKEPLVESPSRLGVSRRLGAFAAAGETDERKEIIGNLYAWAYIIIGFLSLIVWVILTAKGKTSEGVVNTATTFLGMLAAIITADLKD